MCTKCQLVDVTQPVTSNPLASLDWELCIFCQGETAEPLQCPAASKKPDAGAVYRSLADHLTQFHELGELPQQVDQD